MDANADEVLAATRRYWDAVGDRYLEMFRDELEQKPADRAWLIGLAARVGPWARVCDAGCGPCAHVAEILSCLGVRVTGVDLSPRCIELARAVQPALDFRVMDMAAMDVPPASFEGLIAYYSLLYTPRAKLPDVLREFHRVLVPGGELLVVVKEGDGEGWIDDPMGSGEQTYFVNFREAELRGLLESAGFAVHRADVRDPYPFEFPVRRIAVFATRTAP